MKLESTAFSAGDFIPSQYTCDGDDISPALRWDSPPTDTRSLTLIMDDPDAPGRTFVHWIVYDLPDATRQLPESIPPQPTLSQGGFQGRNDFRRYGYGGPCPPRGVHRYVFHLYALDTSLNLPEGASKTELLQAMDGHVLAIAELMGRYSRSRS